MEQVTFQIYLDKSCNNRVFDGTIFANIARFMNHSCDPNCLVAWNAALKKQVVHAIRNIRSGEELTVSYETSDVFEGRDAAGKGGAIKRFMEHLNPRGARVVALEKPTDVERGQWYFQRYVRHLPTAGELVLFDRSWYNRAGVERVMGFCDEAEYIEFMHQAPELERMWARSGVTLIKYWFSVSRDEQRRRFKARESDPLKRWKLSPVDLASVGRWDEYTAAKEAMFRHTDTADAPWTLIKSDDKKRARINCMRHFLSRLDYADKDPAVVGHPDPLIVRQGTRGLSWARPADAAAGDAGVIPAARTGGDPGD